jgi:hypothetical protein
MPNFGNFILESKAAKLLLEGNLMASDKFLKKLLSIRSNPIANTLYQAFSDEKNIEKDLSQNWVDVTDKDDVVTFMSDRAATRFNNDKNVVFTSKGRNEIKVGRFARAILSELGQTALDKDIEVFVNTYKSSNIDNSKKFELVSGPIIKKYYDWKSYADNKGTLGGSCMKDEGCQTYFKIYTKNPEYCQLLVYLDENGKVLGRALLWKLKKKELYNPNTQSIVNCPCEYFMDRVYVANDSDVIKFINIAKERGYLYKYKMTYDHKEGLIFKFGDEVLVGKIVIKLNRSTFRFYPFVDSLCFNDGDSHISNVGFSMDIEDEDAEEGFIMNDTDGRSDECGECGGTGYDDDNGTDCRVCDGDGEVNCLECKGSGSEFCPKCNSGEITCPKCEGSGDYDCPKCEGNGEISCQVCSGDGYKECTVCDGEGNSGPCKKCKGEGEFLCPDCKGEDVVCKQCNGSCKITRTWGKGTRVVNCPGCGGVGKENNGRKGMDGCKCLTCVWIKWTGEWKNTGKITCKDCDGEGLLPCMNCKDKEGIHEQGVIECEECNGRGEYDCDNSGCRYGTISCKNCDGDGSIGICKNCDGDGKLGKCKNPNCDHGQVKCITCNGTGDKPKNYKKSLCHECSGILEIFLDELKSGQKI